MERQKILATLINKYNQRFEIVEIGTFFEVSWTGGPAEDIVKEFLKEQFPEEIFNLNRAE